MLSARKFRVRKIVQLPRLRQALSRAVFSLPLAISALAPCQAHAQQSGAAGGGDLGDPSGPRPQLHLMPLPDAPEKPPEKARAHNEERPFVYMLDPTTPSKGDVSAEYGVGMAPGVAADRPLPATMVAAGSTGFGTLGGFVQSFGVGYGITDRVAPFATVRMGAVEREMGVGGTVGTRLQVTNPESPFHLTLSLGGLREIGGSYGAMGRVAASYDISRVRLAANMHVERVFRERTDPVDLLFMAGASVKAVDQLRVGVEYVAQDLEEIGDPEGAEGGAQQYVGPTLGLDLAGGALQLVGGPAVGLSGRSAGLLGRAAVLATF